MEKVKSKQNSQCHSSHGKVKKIETDTQQHKYGTSRRHMGRMKNMSRHPYRRCQFAELPERGKGRKLKNMKGQVGQRTKIEHKSVEREKAKKEKEQQIKAYKKKRLQKTKAISKRTRYGQPVMKDRMQLLLNQIEEMRKS